LKAEYCREIETYLCQKNEGHLIRVVGPAFDVVSRWEQDGIPLKVAYRGIDRYFERYYRQGPRRRPIRIEFCEADVLDSFDEWRRALGLAAAPAAPAADPADDETVETAAARRGPSLREHLERALLRLTSLRASGALAEAWEPLLDRVSSELDQARESARGLRGERREALLARLAALDDELLQMARSGLDEQAVATLKQEVAEQLRPFRSVMTDDAYQRAAEAALRQAIRERCRLPVLSLL
jgi:hypothetical protein